VTLRRGKTWRARAWSAPAALLLAGVLAACGMFTLTDPYGNSYGGLYEPGAGYRWQLATCEQAIDDRHVPNAGRKDFMRCCMWRHGVPVEDAQSCGPNEG
jgi:hypothetical protein